MILASYFMRLPETEFLKTFEIAIQLGAMGSVFSLYWRTFLLDWGIGLKVLAAFVPTAVIGLLLYKVIKHYLLGSVMVVAIAFVVGGIILIGFELWYKGRQPKVQALDGISYRQAFLIGLCQARSVVPGVSRAGATIVGGLMMGISRPANVSFSFLLKKSAFIYILIALKGKQSFGWSPPSSWR